MIDLYELRTAFFRALMISASAVGFFALLTSITWLFTHSHYIWGSLIALAILTILLYVSEQ